jgi:ABC-2 type transport system permease protein
VTVGTYSPKPGAAPLPRMIMAQAALETKMLLRNGEQLLLTVVIPTLLLVLFSSVDIVDTGAGEAVDFLTPGILALAVMSTAFTGQAIATGFERRYGVLKRLAASPLPRWGLMAAKTASVLVTEILQIALLTVIAFALGWDPQGNPLSVLLLLILGTAAFSGLGLLMAGTLKAEATLAAANLVFRCCSSAAASSCRWKSSRPARRTCWGSCPSRRSRTGCGTCCSTGPGCRGVTWGFSRSGRSWDWRPPGSSSAGSNAFHEPLVKACTSSGLRWGACQT